MTKTAALIDTSISWIVVFTLAIIPLFFLPITNDFYQVNKWALLILSSGMVALLWSAKTVITRTLHIPLFKTNAGFIACTAAAFISIIVSSTNRAEAFSHPIGIGTFFSLAILSGAGLLYRSHIRTKLTWSMLISGAILGLIALYTFFGIGKMMSSFAPFLSDKLWTPTGVSISLLSIFMILIPLAVSEAIMGFRNKNETQLTVSVIASVIMIAGFTVTAIQYIPMIPNSLMSPSVGWAVLLEMFKQPKAFLFGIGAENYPNAYTIGKPLFANALNTWNIRFNLGSNVLFHITTVLGLGGLAGILLLCKNLLLPFHVRDMSYAPISSILAVIALVIAVPDISLFAVIAALLLIKHTSRETARHQDIPEGLHWITSAIAVFVCTIIVVGTYFFGRFYLADMAFARSLKAAQVNDGTKTYNEQAKAIQLNPYMTTYRISYAQVNVALANSVANAAKTKTPKDEQVKLSEEDQKLMTQLIQQAIEQGKIAVTLSPNSVAAWETLASVYQNITGVVQNADSWTIAAYQKAITLDPNNPLLRQNAAGFFLSQGNYDAARQLLEAAVQLKSDNANSHYNLAFVYKNLKDYARQKTALENTLSLLATNSDDAKKVQKELAEVKLMLPETASQSAQTNSPNAQQVQPGEQLLLNAQSPVPTREITPKLDIVNPNASPSVSPTVPLP